MKKPIYKRPWFLILGGIIVLAVLFGGGDSPEEEPLGVVDQNEIVEAEPIDEEVPEEEPILIEEPVVTEEVFTDSMYLMEMSDIHINMSSSLIKMGELFENPLFHDQDWIFDSVLEITMIQMYAEEILNMTNVPEIYKEAHFKYANDGAVLLYRAMDMLPEAIDARDAATINLAATYMAMYTDEMNAYLATVTATPLP